MKKVIKHVLQPSEKVVATSKGTLNKMTATVAGAVSEAASFNATGVISKRKKKKKKLNWGLLEVYFCLTDKRFMIFETTWYGSPRKLWSSVDISEIEEIKLSFTRVFWKLPQVKIIPKKGKKIGFWSAKIHKKKTLHLVEEMQRLINK